MTENTRLYFLFQKYLQDTLQSSELDELIALIQDDDQRERLEKLVVSYYANESEVSKVLRSKVTDLVDSSWHNIEKGIKSDFGKVVPIPRKSIHWMPYAAACVLVIGLSLWGYLHFSGQKKALVEHVVDAGHILPGGNKAMLFLPDGRTINLSESQASILFNRKDAISYEDGSFVDASANRADLDKSKSGIVRLETPRGGNYKVVLADGTSVWLNAASVLRYPSRFVGESREVELEGEAFFSVSKGKKPFIVKAGDQLIEVHGTKFNVNSYHQRSTVTTLVEGKVSVSSKKKIAPVLLSPGQQSVLVKDKVTVQTANIQSATSWKDGVFFFRDAPIPVVMEQLSRWYDVPIRYQKKVPTGNINGEIYKDITLSEAIKILNQLSISCYYDGHQLVVR